MSLPASRETCAFDGLSERAALVDDGLGLDLVSRAGHRHRLQLAIGLHEVEAEVGERLVPRVAQDGVAVDEGAVVVNV